MARPRAVCWQRLRARSPSPCTSSVWGNSWTSWRPSAHASSRRPCWTEPRVPDHLFVLVIGAAIGGLVQGLSGSNFGMTATSIWAWFLAPQLVAPLSLTGSLSGQILGALTLRRGWHWRRFAPFLCGGLLGIPLGGVLLPRL